MTSTPQSDLSSLQAVLAEGLAAYRALAEGFDVDRPPPDERFREAAAMLRRALPLLRERSEADADRMDELLAQCEEPYHVNPHLHVSPHVRLYPLYDALEVLRQATDRQTSRGKAGRGRVGFVICAAILLGTMLWGGLVLASAIRGAAAFSAEIVGENLPPPSIPVTLKGLDDMETEKGKTWRWSREPATLLTFSMPERTPLILVLNINNSLPGQSVTVLVNERVLARLENMPLHAWDDRGQHVALPFVSVAGENRVRIEYGTWNNKDGNAYVPDPRLLGVKYYRIGLVRNDLLARAGQRLFRQ